MPLKSPLLLFALFFAPLLAVAQADTARWKTVRPHAYKFISSGGNVISNAKTLHPFFEKLYELRRDHKGVVNVVHIGDSHIQADMMTSHLRNGFQQYFGNAGRGLLFAWQLAKSNGAADVTSSSNVTWQYNRLSHPEINIQTGISGFGIHTSQRNAQVRMRLKPVDSVQQYFNKLTFFTGGTDCYKLGIPGQDGYVSKDKDAGKNGNPELMYTLDAPATEFELTGCPSEAGGNAMSFYGVSLEHTDSAGVIYHTLGVNGAQYQQYNNVGLFWEQLRYLKGSLFIVSMGTNEAQNHSFNEDTFFAICDTFLAHVRSLNPDAALILTTPAGSYYKAKAPNTVLPKVTEAMIRFCKERHLAYWDLYTLGGGKPGTVQWKKNNLLARDLVHYNAAGYTLQGQLLLAAISHAYNDYVAHRPKEKKPGKTNKTAGKHMRSKVKTADTVSKRPPETRKTEEPAPPDTRKHIIKVTLED